MRKIWIILLVLVLAFVLVGCGKVAENITPSQNEQNEQEEQNTTDNNEEELNLKPVDRYKDIEKNPVVTMEMEDGGVVKMELYPKIAPESVENFISLINSGYYDGLTFHRTIPGFMAQGGDKNGDGTGGPGYTIYGEFSNNNDFKNDISHERGVLSMARAGNPYNPESAYNTAGSQFFIVTTDSTFLDGDYAAFGKVTEGMDEVDEIVNVEVITREPYEEGADRPVNPPVIKKMTVETFGVTYTEPTKITK